LAWPQGAGGWIAGSSWRRKLQNFAFWSYCFAAIVRVFHVQQPAISSRLP
jgi:hypothetical protein